MSTRTRSSTRRQRQSEQKQDTSTDSSSSSSAAAVAPTAVQPDTGGKKRKRKSNDSGTSSKSSTKKSKDESLDEKQQLAIGVTPSSSSLSSSSSSVASPPLSLDSSIDLSPVMVNRAPVLTLWAALCAQFGPKHLTYPEGLTVGRYIAGLLAQSRGQAEGIFEKPERTEAEKQRRREERQRQLGDHEMIYVIGIETPIRQTQQGRFALTNGTPMRPSSAYIDSAFKQDRDRVISVMIYLIKALISAHGGNDVLAGKDAYQIYEKIRPTSDGYRPAWGQPGTLNLAAMKDMADKLIQQRREDGIQTKLTATATSSTSTNSDEKEEKKTDSSGSSSSKT